MSKVRRNDPCPCGSGIKYKKCCGSNNAPSFNPSFYHTELNKLNDQLMEFALTHFGNELLEHSQTYIDTYIGNSDEEEIGRFMTVLHAWIVLKQPIKDDKTIFDFFYEAHEQTIEQPSIKKVFSMWGKACGSAFEMIARKDPSHKTMVLRDLQTDYTYDYIRPDAADNIDGDYVLGMLVPYVGTHAFFFSTMHIAKEDSDKIVELFDKDATSEQDVFPALVAQAMGVEQVEEAPVTEWAEPSHEQVADLFGKHMTAKGFDAETVQKGLQFWVRFCEETRPIIQKPLIYAAALDYFVQQTYVEESTATQSQLAKEYGTSPGSVSTNYQKFARLIDLS